MASAAIKAQKVAQRQVQDVKLGVPVLKDAGEEGLHLREICSRIAKQTDISALTTREGPRDEISLTCSKLPLVFARVGKKRSGHYRIAEAYL
eukprot:CAMPEP_0196638926 /NCGR_PEP_ID=MMETSP1085-20130531/1639_1 /TAXON_ID=41879 ORGANISM="Pycnococcus sp, Strain CCMP1998" /NCGR_SAMPLE_ID=MMETSP1085 /ASSEMBLY_ACC=CAM_ASM_000807 /LENGTH=91 /DNA_ID=CAMNT_0041967855 /DNA_START=17 /DNA_END=293 /DNA_ORIENTATION=-